MTKLISPDWVVQFDWDTLDGKTLECKVMESEGVKLVMLFDPETEDYYLIDAIMSPTIH